MGESRGASPNMINKNQPRKGAPDASQRGQSFSSDHGFKDAGRADAQKSRLAAIYLECYGSLRTFIARYLRRPEDVEDIAQETFVRVHEVRRKSSILNLKAYLFTTARNLALKHLALHANKLTDSLEDLGMWEVMDGRTSLESEYESREQLSIFYEAVKELPPQCRRVLILKKVHGLSHKEIAERLNITVSTTNQHMAKGIALCTLHMREKGYLDESGGEREERQSDE